MNVVVLLAGGSGQRLGAEKPKQFVEINGKPLIVYALERYEESPVIDAVEVVCVPQYIDYVWDLAKKYHIKKMRWVIPGGTSCQESTRNGIFALEGICKEDDYLSINMSTSLFVSDEILEDSFQTARENGNAFAAMQCIYNLAYSTDGKTSTLLNYKEVNKTLNMPWTASFGKFDTLYKKAYAENIETKDTSYAPTLFLAMGETLFLSKDTAKNKLHVTTKDDIDIIKACLLMKEQCSEEK